MGLVGVVAGPRLGTPATLGVAGVGVGTGFVSLTTLWRAYRRQRYRSWPSADAECVFCVVCVQFLALCRRWAKQASLLGQVLDCRRRGECTQRCWSASVWQLGTVEEGLCGVVPPKDWQVGTVGEVMSPIPTHYHVWYGYAYELRDYGAQRWYARGVLCGAHAGFGCAYHCGDCGLRERWSRFALCTLWFCSTLRF